MNLIIEVGNLKVAPFEFERILELKIEKAINEHAVLYVRGIVVYDWNSRPVADTAEGTAVKCEDGANTYFCGVLKSVIITCENDIYYLEAHAVSQTIKLDTEKFKRSFQEDGRTYEDIIGAITGEKGGVMHYNAGAKAVERILVQYDETDWQFAKRLASHTQDVLIAMSKSDGPEFHVGVEDESYAGEIITNNFSVFKDFDLLRLRSNDEKPLAEGDITMYQVKTDDFSYSSFDAGDKVLLNGIEGLYVRRSVLSLTQSHLISTYTLASKNAMTAPKAYNPKITGLALSGVVTAVENDDVRLDLDIDYGVGSTHLFKYATPYSMEGHTGWYVMPEPGDRLQLVFSTEDERDVYATTSIRQGQTGKTSDPMTKYLRTSYGKEIKFNASEILITGKDNDTFIRINEDSGIHINSTKPINITSDGAMGIISKGDMTISTDSNLAINAEESITMTCKGNHVSFAPSTGIAISTDQKCSLSSQGDMSLSSEGNKSISTKGDLTISASKNIIGAGLLSVTLSNLLNVVSMNPITGIAIATPIALNMAGSLGGASISGRKIDLNATTDVTTSAGKKLKLNGVAEVALSGGASGIKLGPGGVDIKGPKVKEN